MTVVDARPIIAAGDEPFETITAAAIAPSWSIPLQQTRWFA